MVIRTTTPLHLYVRPLLIWIYEYIHWRVACLRLEGRRWLERKALALDVHNAAGFRGRFREWVRVMP
jgi:hypothetical protein